MTRKTNLFTLMAVCAALLILPTAASAGTWHAETAVGLSPGAFSGTGGKGELITTSGLAITCITTTVAGSFDAGSTTTGTIQLSFHDCPTQFGSCAIKTTVLPFHTVHLEPDRSRPGILITPPAGSSHIADMNSCLAFSSLSGNGILAELIKPKCGESGTEATFSLARVSGGHQKWTQITTSGTAYDLSTTAFSYSTTTSIDASATVKFAQAIKVNCT